MDSRKKIKASEIRKFGVARPLAENINEAVKQYGGSKYDMIIIAAARARQLSKGDTPLVTGDHKPVVTALLEIEAGHIKDSMRWQ